MVEVVCELGINGPRPMRVGNIPQFNLGLLVNQVSCEKLIVDAYFENSYQKALEAFTLNRLINDGSVGHSACRRPHCGAAAGTHLKRIRGCGRNCGNHT